MKQVESFPVLKEITCCMSIIAVVNNNLESNEEIHGVIAKYIGGQKKKMKLNQTDHIQILPMRE